MKRNLTRATIVVSLMAFSLSLRAETAVSLDAQIGWSDIIVRARQVGPFTSEDGHLVTFEVVETLKGKIDPTTFMTGWKDGRIHAAQGEHGVNVGEGQEIVFFYGKHNQPPGRYEHHNTSLPIKGGKMIYGATYGPGGGFPKAITLKELKQAIAEEGARHAQVPEVPDFLMTFLPEGRVVPESQQKSAVAWDKMILRSPLVLTQEAYSHSASAGLGTKFDIISNRYSGPLPIVETLQTKYCWALKLNVGAFAIYDRANADALLKQVFGREIEVKWGEDRALNRGHINFVGDLAMEDVPELDASNEGSEKKSQWLREHPNYRPLWATQMECVLLDQAILVYTIKAEVPESGDQAPSLDPASNVRWWTK